LPAAQVTYIDRCGHDPTIEQPDEFARVVVSFLRWHHIKQSVISCQRK